MLFRIILGVSLTLALLLSGCATDKGMAVMDSPAAVTQSGKAIYLLTVTLRNNHVTAYQPKLQTIKVHQHSNAEYPKIIRFTADPLAKSESNSAAIGSSYLLRIELEPGTYTLLGLSCLGQSVFVNGDFFAPLAISLTASTPGVYYLGHVEASVRAHQKDEFRAGPFMPLQEQSLTGASSGTFDVEISDHETTDLPKFLAKFPVLNGITIQKTVLSPFNRERVQRWWEKNAFNDVP